MKHWFQDFFFLTIVTFITRSRTDQTTIYVCEGHPQTINCNGRGENSIEIIEGKYGRFDWNVCPHSSIRTVNCISQTANTVITNLCNGKVTCYLNPSNGMFSGDPCPGTYKYAEVTYTCGEDVTSEAVTTTESTTTTTQPLTTTTSKTSTTTTEVESNTTPYSTNDRSTSSNSPTSVEPDTTEISTAVSTNTTSSASSNSTSPCECKCIPLKDEDTGCMFDDAECIVAALRQQLTVPQKSLSAFKNKKISAFDARTSSKAIGFFGILILVFVASIIIIPDVLSLLKFLLVSH